MMPTHRYRIRPVSSARTSLFIAIVSLFVLTGYGFDLFGDCCAHHEQAQVEHGKSAPNDQPPGGGEGCQCLCHQIVTPVTPEPEWVADAVFISADLVAPPDEFPPDAAPLGIDYPPQLA